MAMNMVHEELEIFETMSELDCDRQSAILYLDEHPTYSHSQEQIDKQYEADLLYWETIEWEEDEKYYQ